MKLVNTSAFIVFFLIERHPRRYANCTPESLKSQLSLHRNLFIDYR